MSFIPFSLCVLPGLTQSLDLMINYIQMIFKYISYLISPIYLLPVGLVTRSSHSHQHVPNWIRIFRLLFYCLFGGKYKHTLKGIRNENCQSLHLSCLQLPCSHSHSKHSVQFEIQHLIDTFLICHFYLHNLPTKLRHM